MVAIKVFGMYMVIYDLFRSVLESIPIQNTTFFGAIENSPIFFYKTAPLNIIEASYSSIKGLQTTF